MIGIKKHFEKQLSYKGDFDHWYNVCLSAVEHGGFSNIQDDKSAKTIKADFHKFTTWGTIELVVLQEGDSANINVLCSAKSDNLYSIAQDPSEKIYLAFKNSLPNNT